MTELDEARAAVVRAAELPMDCDCKACQNWRAAVEAALAAFERAVQAVHPLRPRAMPELREQAAVSTGRTGYTPQDFETGTALAAAREAELLQTRRAIKAEREVAALRARVQALEDEIESAVRRLSYFDHPVLILEVRDDLRKALAETDPKGDSRAVGAR